MSNDAFKTPHLKQDALFTGVVIDVIQYANCYVVSVDQHAPTTAYALNPISSTSMSYHNHAMFQPGTRVLLFKPNMGSQFVILGSISGENSWDRLNLPDWIYINSNASFKDNKAHNYLTTINNGGLIRNFNNNTPVDVLPGEVGWSNALGLGLHLGQTMTFLRASEIAGLYVFQPNNEVRLAAYNYKLWTAGREFEAVNDEGEITEITRLSPYPWNMLGSKTYGQGGTKEGESSNKWEAHGKELPQEPKYPDQDGVYRYHQFTGFLGDIERTIVSLPPKDLDDVERYSNKSVHIGLAERSLSTNGVVSTRSAKGIYSVKELLIPVPKQLVKPDDPSGDNSSENTYKFAGVIGEGDPHEKSDFTAARETDALSKFTQWQDLHAWFNNSYLQAGFQLHKKDWYLPQESEILEAMDIESAVDPAIQQSLGLKAYADVPAYIELEIDQREGHTHRYYRSRSVIAQTDDGGVLLEDGYGSQIMMGGGSITFSAPGDIWNRPGRNLINLAPRDAITRAGNCVDISASLGDVRIKAEKNLHLLGGNSGDTGGILLESKARGFADDFVGKVGTDVKHSGIAFVAKDSQITMYSNRIYSRAVSGKVGKGVICLDGDNGKGDIYMFARNRFETVKKSVQTAFGVSPNEAAKPLVVEVHNKQQVFFGQRQRLFTNARTFMAPRATIYTGKRVWAKGGFIHNRAPSKISGPWPSAVVGFVNSATSDAQAVTDVVQTQRTFAVDRFYSENAPGTDANVKAIGFTLRNDDQYGITNLVIHEARWQQWYRTQKKPKQWKEPVVKSSFGDKTQPFPGYESWTKKRLYIKIDNKHWDGKKNKDRLYKKDEPGSDDAVKSVNAALATSYVITVQQHE